MESSQKTNTALKIGLVLFLVLFIGTLVYTFSLYNNNKETQNALLVEKQQIMGDYNALTKQYNEAIAENESQNNDLIAARDRIENLIVSLKKSQNSVNNLISYRKKLFALQDEMAILLKENDRLKVENNLLATSLDSTQIQLEKRTVYTDSLLTQNTKLTSVVESASTLQAVSLIGVGVIERSNGKQIPTERAKRSDKLKICFTIAKNTLAEAGDKELYVQVIDPKNNVLGTNNQVQFGEQILNYSLISHFNYENKNLDICEYVSSPNDSKFKKGRYIIHVFNNKELISSSEFALR